ncbi:MAG TPA: hypothetical protein VIZ00_11460 [Streptosporangiaceae bacterium]
MTVIAQSTGKLMAGNVLVSNSSGARGNNIVQISPSGHRTVFASLPGKLPGQCPGGVQLTAALTVLPGGWVIAGSDPAGGQNGCLIVIGPQGHVRETIAGDDVAGPWGSAAVSQVHGTGWISQLFVSTTLNGTWAGKGTVVRGGTVERLTIAIPGNTLPQLTDVTPVVSGLAEQVKAGKVFGPAGVAVNPSSSVLVVADSDTNQISWVAHATTRGATGGPGTFLTGAGVLPGGLGALSVPQGLAIAPTNGNVLTVNAGNGKIVDTTPVGQQIANRRLGGSLAALAVAPRGTGVYFTDAAAGSLRLLH